ncbi:hypothetical protein SASPL_140577 [Salvia splendens]|uniref:peptidylprolyl isomerase n=1 Tax=Salvia splendens TaxID=180675 RepID=A0A8X8ZC25_SALSN|nr:hypothetical protein SASPL_140577 [Salvia splendens]
MGSHEEERLLLEEGHVHVESGSDGLHTGDGSVDSKGNPVLKSKTGNWRACPYILVNLRSWPEVSQASEDLQLNSIAAKLEYILAWHARLETRLSEHERRAAATLPPLRLEPDPPDETSLYAAARPQFQFTCYQPTPSPNTDQLPPPYTYTDSYALLQSLYAEQLNPPPPYVPLRQAYSYHEHPCWPVPVVVPQEPYTYSDLFAPLQNSYARYHSWQYNYQPTNFTSQPPLQRSEYPLQPPQPQQSSYSHNCSAPAPPPPVVVLNATLTTSHEKVEDLSKSLEEALAKQAEESDDLMDCERDYNMLPIVVELSAHNCKGDVRQAVEPRSQTNELPIKYQGGANRSEHICITDVAINTAVGVDVSDEIEQSEGSQDEAREMLRDNKVLPRSALQVLPRNRMIGGQRLLDRWSWAGLLESSRHHYGHLIYGRKSHGALAHDKPSNGVHGPSGTATARKPTAKPNCRDAGTPTCQGAANPSQVHECDRVDIHYKRKLIDATIFNPTFERGDPIDIKLGSGQVIKRWLLVLGMCLGTCYLTPLIGAILADAYWGGNVHFDSIPYFKPPECVDSVCPSASDAQYAIFFFGLYLIALGTGGIKPCVSSFGADQLDDTDPVESVRKISFFSGTNLYRFQRPGGSPITRMCQVLVASFRKWNLDVPDDSSLLYELPDKSSAIEGSRKLLHTNELKCLDKAAVISDAESNHGDYSNAWNLCTQGMVMDTSIGSFLIPAASLSTFDVISVIFWVPMYDKVLVPLAKMFTGQDRGFTELQRMVVGLFLSILCMSAAAIVEVFRLSYVVDTAVAAPMSIFWQIPQYLLLGAAEVFTFIGQLEFFYDQSPDAMRSLCTALSLLTNALGNYLSSFILTVVTSLTTQGGQPGWTPNNLNVGHLDYLLLASRSSQLLQSGGIRLVCHNVQIQESIMKFNLCILSL